ncbi:MAG: phage tail assembly protein [Bdellovibrionales bacterium]
MLIRTEFEFELPKGFLSEDGTLHRKGVMRLATAADEILPLRDPRVQANQDYLTVILLSRVITRLGDIKDISPALIERLYAKDFYFLQEFYNRINESASAKFHSECPKCQHRFETEVSFAGESQLTQ